jgi:hypothetical protein
MGARETMTEFRDREPYTTVYVEVTWQDGKTEEITLVDGTAREDVDREVAAIRTDDRFIAFIQWDGSLVVFRLDQMRKFRIHFKERYR